AHLGAPSPDAPGASDQARSATAFGRNTQPARTTRLPTGSPIRMAPVGTSDLEFPMGLSLKPRYLRRYRDIARLLLKYGRGSLLTPDAPDVLEGERLDEDADEPSEGAEPAVAGGSARAADRERAAELPGDLERLGPTFVKIGQLLSSRADLLPPAY